MIPVVVNGESCSCPETISMVKLLEFLEFNPRLVALELNGEILHRQFWETTQLSSNDRVEIVTIVGGG